MEWEGYGVLGKEVDCSERGWLSEMTAVGLCMGHRLHGL